MADAAQTLQAHTEYTQGKRADAEGDPRYRRPATPQRAAKESSADTEGSSSQAHSARQPDDLDATAAATHIDVTSLEAMELHRRWKDISVARRHAARTATAQGEPGQVEQTRQKGRYSGEVGETRPRRRDAGTTTGTDPEGQGTFAAGTSRWTIYIGEFPGL